MDFFGILTICVIFIIVFTLCGWCCKRKREGTVYGYGPSVTITTQQVPAATPVVAPPYPVEARHPTPQAVPPPAPGFATYNPPYPTHMPHIPAGGQTPYPPAPTTTPYPPGPATPYPVSSAGDYSHPPPYDVAVSTPPARPPPVQEAYGKQAPYNPNFN